MKGGGENARKANTPWRQWRPKVDNAAANRRAVSKMTQCQLLTGKTVEELDAEHAEQRARVLAKYGVAA